MTIPLCVRLCVCVFVSHCVSSSNHEAQLCISVSNSFPVHQHSFWCPYAAAATHTHQSTHTHRVKEGRTHLSTHNVKQVMTIPQGHTHTNPLTPFPSQSASLANIWNIKRRWWHPTAHNDQSVTMETTHRRRPRHRHEGVILGEREEHSVPVNKQISSFQHDFVRNAFRASASRSRRRILQNCVHYALSPSSTLSLRWR